MRFVVNEGKTKMAVDTAREKPRRKKGEIVTARNCNIEVVEELIYLEAALNQKCGDYTKKQRIAYAYMCFVMLF